MTKSTTWWCCPKDEVRHELGGMRELWRAGEESAATTTTYSADSAVPPPVLVWMRLREGMGRGSHLAGDAPGVCPLAAVTHSLFLEGEPWETRGGVSPWVKKFSAGKQGLFSPFPPGGGQPTSLYLSAVPGTGQGTGFGGKQAQRCHLP